MKHDKNKELAVRRRQADATPATQSHGDVVSTQSTRGDAIELVRSLVNIEDAAPPSGPITNIPPVPAGGQQNITINIVNRSHHEAPRIAYEHTVSYGTDLRDVIGRAFRWGSTVLIVAILVFGFVSIFGEPKIRFGSSYYGVSGRSPITSNTDGLPAVRLIMPETTPLEHVLKQLKPGESDEGQ